MCLMITYYKLGNDVVLYILQNQEVLEKRIIDIQVFHSQTLRKFQTGKDEGNYVG